MKMVRAGGYKFPCVLIEVFSFFLISFSQHGVILEFLTMSHEP